MTRTKIAVGSMLGALALHVVMVACGSAPPSTPGDAGVLADVRDAIVDALQDVIDAETPDAHAGGDGGVPPADGGVIPDGGAPACNCPAPPRPEYSFSGAAVNRGSSPELPEADHSTALVAVTQRRAADGTLLVTLTATLSFYLRDGSSFYLQCYTAARADTRAIVPTAGTMGPMDGTCIAQVSAGDAGAVTDREVVLSGVVVEDLTNDRVTIRLPEMRVTRDRVAAVATIGTTTVRAFVPGAAFVTTPRAYRP